MIALLVAGAASLAVVVRAQARTAQARAAADLAALAAADAMALPDGLVMAAGGPGPWTVAACDRAREVADRNGASVTSCEVEPAGVVVVAVRAAGMWPGEASARAGPRSAAPGP